MMIIIYTFSPVKMTNWLTLFVELMACNVQVIFVSPEKIVDPTWMKRLISYYSKNCVAIAFDEAHCISEW